MSSGSPANPENRSEADFFASLSQSLESLSILGESLTLRLLELEERLETVEAKITQLPQIQANEGEEIHSETSKTLDCTEQRIAQLEDLLTN
jgi:TolA-binding protein